MLAFINAISSLNNNYENNHRIVSSIINMDDASPLSNLFTSIISVSITNYNLQEDLRVELDEEKMEKIENKFAFLHFSDFDHESKEMHKECSICLDDFSDSSEIVLTDCNHCYHQKCLKEWFTHQRRCPICRNDWVRV